MGNKLPILPGCRVLEANFAPDPDGKTDCGNSCLFTGRRANILDNGSLKIQYNRNRYHDYYTGRWLTEDLLGISPPCGPNKAFWWQDKCPRKADSQAIKADDEMQLLEMLMRRPLAERATHLQYTDGMSLYQYVSSRPTVTFDPTGESWKWLPFYGTYLATKPAFGTSVYGYAGCAPKWCGDPCGEVVQAKKCVKCVEELQSISMVGSKKDILMHWGGDTVAEACAAAGGVGDYGALALVGDGVTYLILKGMDALWICEARRFAKWEYCLIPPSSAHPGGECWYCGIVGMYE
ncbi:MAG: hypothetical protein ACYTEQ_21885 [Planctomycetota bacterium]|jgi:hypothetical protein